MTRELRDSGVGWLGDIPTDWSVVPARALFGERKQKSSVTDVHLTPSQKYGVLPQAEYMEITGSKVVLNLSGADKMRHVEAGDYVSHLRSFQGGLEFAGIPGKVSAAYTVLKPKVALVPRFFKYLFKSDLYVQALQTTTDQLRDGQSIRYAQFTLIPLPRPSLEEQRAIAEYLDRETAQIDAFIAKNEELITLLTERRASSVVELIGKHDTIPLKRLVSPKRPLTYGILQCGEPVESGVPYIGPSDLPGEGASPTLESLRRTTPEIAAAYGRSVLEGGDIVVSIGPAFGRVGLLSTDLKGANLTQDTVRVATMSPKIDANYLVWVLSSRIANDFWDYEILGATFRRLNLGTLGETPIPYPPLDEQRRIAVAIAEAVAKVDSAIGVARRAVELARERRAALISAAVTGKIDVGVAM